MNSNTWGWIAGGTVLAGGAIVVGAKLAQKSRATPSYFTVPAASTPAATPVSAPPAEATNSQSIPVYRYTVQPGDTLSGIAAADGTTVAVLAQLNHLSNVNRIDAGQTLLVLHPLSASAVAGTQKSGTTSDAGSMTSAPGPGVDGGRVRRTAPAAGSVSCTEYPSLCGHVVTYH